MTARAAILAGAFALCPQTTHAITLDFPATANISSEITEPLGSYRVPTGPYANGEVSGITAEGEILRQAWRVGAGGLTTLQILSPLRDQLAQAGYEALFECSTDDCGGFDFRYDTDVLPEPAMHVDLGDFRFLSARRNAGETPEYVSLMVSRSRGAGYVQVVHINGETAGTAIVTTSTKGPVAGPAATIAPVGPMPETLERTGGYILDDLTFETGSSSLGQGSFSSLAALADYLRSNPARTVALVGHTDAEGPLSGNIALSKKRAASVVERLVSVHDVSRTQLGAEGVGFLAPRASNLDDIGRAQNRRVEVILTSTR
ncbi:OmpA family protein [Pseudogemmobacter sp. W21_MBD1_M6]|uniref:OmpA family protein n=1 Tax=Pseudogemmobacter sp. W21_MBD1_M6 TaxID=3240271 RepID=UPI003F9E7B79